MRTLGTWLLTVVLLSVAPGACKSKSTALTPEERCLALNVYHESRGESRLGQEAVAHVTLNRAHDRRYPATICGVVYQRSQFSWTKHTDLPPPQEQAAWVRSVEVAKRAIEGQSLDPTSGSLLFHNGSVAPRWSRSAQVQHSVNIGQHRFYRDLMARPRQTEVLITSAPIGPLNTVDTSTVIIMQE